MPAEPVQPDPSRFFLRLGDRRWTQRRVEELSVIGRRLVQRRVMVAVKVPEVDADATVGGKKIAFLPLNWYEKRSDTQERVFQVVDEQQQVVPALAPQDSERLVSEALLTAARCLLGAAAEPTAVLAASMSGAVRAQDPAGVRDHLGELRRRLASLAPSDEGGAGLWRRKEALLTVVGTVTRHRLLVVPVPADDQPHCFTFEYVSSQQFERLRSGRPFDRFAKRMGWRPMEWEFEVPGAALTPLLHVVFRAPEGVAISSSQLEVSPGSCDRGLGDPTMHQIDHRRSRRSSTGAKATFWLEPHRIGLPTNGLVASAIIAAMLVAGAVRHDLLQGVAGQADAAAALLLAAPSFFLLQAVQSFEHRVVSSMLRGLRWTLLAVGLMALVAALLLVAIAAGSTPPHALWWLLTTIALLGSASLAITFRFGTQASRASPNAMAAPPPRPTGDGLGASPFRVRARQVLGEVLVGLIVLACGARVLVTVGNAAEQRGLVTLPPPSQINLGPYIPSLLVVLVAAATLVMLRLLPARTPADGPDPPERPETSGRADGEAFLAAFDCVVEAASPRSPMP